MAEMVTKIRKEVKSFELSQLEKFIETLESYLLYLNALDSINGGYATVTAYDIDDEDICIEGEYGEQDMGSGSSYTQKEHCVLSREVLVNKDISMRNKLETLTWGY